MVFLPAFTRLVKLIKRVRAWPGARSAPPWRSLRDGLELRRCSRCDHPYLALLDEPAPQWFTLCPRCQQVIREVLLALLVVLLLVGLMGLAIGP